MAKGRARKRSDSAFSPDFGVFTPLRLGPSLGPKDVSPHRLCMASKLVALEKTDPESFWFWMGQISIGRSLPGQRISRRVALARLEAQRRLAKRDGIKRKDFIKDYKCDPGFSWSVTSVRDYLRKDIPQLLKEDGLFEYEVELIMVELRPELEKELMSKYEEWDGYY